MQRFRDAVAVITGGASGIGHGLAEALAVEGAHLVVADIEAGKAESVAAEARERGVRAIGVQMDVSDPASVEALADRSYREFGRVNLLCSNAGVLHSRSLAETTEADWRWQIGVNLWGAVYCTNAFLPRMLAQPAESGERHMLYTSSTAGLVPLTGGSGLGAYTVTKYGVVGLAEMLSSELAPAGIGVSVLCPGGVDTGIFTSARNRPAALGGPETPPARPANPNAERMEPIEVARRTLAGLRANRLYILSHPQQFEAQIEARFQRILGETRAAAAEG